MFCLHLLAFYGLPNFKHLGSLPSYFFFPPSFSLGPLLAGFPSSTVLAIIQILVALSFLLMLVGYRTTLSSVTFSITFILLHTIAYSTGKINHNFPHIVLPLFMAFTNWGNHYSVDAVFKRKTYYNSKYTLSIFAMGLAISFAIAGLYKILGHWLETDTQATLSVVLRKGGDWSSHWPTWIFEVSDWLVVLFELGFLLLYPKLKWFGYCCLAAIVFHITVSLSLDIYFIGLPIIYLPFFMMRFSTIRLKKARQISTQQGKLALVLAILLTAIYGIQYVAGDNTWIDEALLLPLFSALPTENPMKAMAIAMQGSFLVWGAWMVFKPQQTSLN